MAGRAADFACDDAGVWPDCGSGSPWAGKKAVDLHSVGLPGELADHLKARNGQYAEDKLPLEGSEDAEWISDGTTLLRRTRAALGASVTVIVTEPWWDEEPSCSRQFRMGQRRRVPSLYGSGAPAGMRSAKGTPTAS